MNDLGVAFDLGTEKTGIFIVKDGDFAKGRPILVSTSAGELRQFAMAEKIIAIWDTLQEMPDWVCFENVYLGNNPHTYRQLVGLRAIVEFEVRKTVQAVHEATTAEIDKVCGIMAAKGQRKAATMRFAELLHGVMGQDPADALCVAYYGYHAFRQERWAQGETEL